MDGEKRKVLFFMYLQQKRYSRRMDKEMEEKNEEI